MLQIVTAPSDILSNTAKPIGKIDEDVLLLIEEMKKTLEKTTDPKGVGLAAPQVGESLQLFIIKPTTNAKEKIFINPRIVSLEAPIESNLKNSLKGKTLKEARKHRKETKLEGCLSLPSIWGPVQRAPSLRLYYLDEQGKSHTKTFKGFFATIVQHEYDHLQGILFPRRVLEQKGKLYKAKKDKKGETIFKEIEI